jgi:hypothetical protein
VDAGYNTWREGKKVEGSGRCTESDDIDRDDNEQIDDGCRFALG